MTYLFDYSNLVENNKNIFHNYANNNINPVINLKETKKFINTLKEIRSIVGDETLIYLQVMADTPEKITKIIKTVSEEVGGKLYIKTDNNVQGNIAKKRLALENIVIVTVKTNEEKYKEISKKPEYIILKVIDEKFNIYQKVVKKLISSNLNYNNTFVSDWRKL